MSKPAVKVENVSVMFNLNKEKVDNVKEYFIKLITRKLRFTEFWALQDISFTIQKGKVTRLTNLNLWIPNAVLVRTNGARETGRIIQDLPSKYEFEPSPGVKFTVEKSSVRKVEYLPESE